jgi:formylmethanofuran--tetrahydromethanopterin N-formyltransferase
LKLGDTFIEDTFAEAFRMVYARLWITAHDEYWLDAAIRELTGYSSSVISCDAETGLERKLSAHETPDGRVGAAVLVFGFSADTLGKALANRVGQCVMTCPTTAVFNGLPDAEQRVPLGKNIRLFGDGFQKSKLLEGKRYWRIPVMDGEFLVEDNVGVEKGVAGGNVIVQAADKPSGLAAVRRGVEAIDDLPGAITPFPGGVARSGSKVGSRYKGLPASTSDAFCPTLRGRVETKLLDGVNCVYEVVIDGASEEAVAKAMSGAIRAAAGDGVIAISAGNYGGKLGKFHFKLHDLLKT